MDSPQPANYAHSPAQHPAYWWVQMVTQLILGLARQSKLIIPVAGLAGLLWGLLRIELVLVVPYFYLIVYIADAVAYALGGSIVGQALGRSAARLRGVQVVLAVTCMYLADRFLSARLLLGLAFAGRLAPTWRLAVEAGIFTIALIVAGWSSDPGVRPPCHLIKLCRGQAEIGGASKCASVAALRNPL